MSVFAEADMVETVEDCGPPARRLVVSVSDEAEMVETGEVCG